jgi:DNA-binding NtrC family response regulator
LENTLTRAVVRATGDVIRPEHVVTATGNAVAPDELESLEDLERRQVARVLQASRGNKTKAAEILGVSRPRLHRLLAKYDLR